MTDQPPEGPDAPQPQHPGHPGHPGQPERPVQPPPQPASGPPPGPPGPPPGQWPGPPPPYQPGPLPPHQQGRPGQPQHLPPGYAGAYGPTYGAPLPTGLPNWAKIVLGALIGLVASVGSPLVAFGVAGLDAPVELLVLLVTVIPPLLATPLLIARSTRTWGVGVMLGLAVGSFVLGGACVSLISGY